VRLSSFCLSAFNSSPRHLRVPVSGPRRSTAGTASRALIWLLQARKNKSDSKPKGASAAMLETAATTAETLRPSLPSGRARPGRAGMYLFRLFLSIVIDFGASFCVPVLRFSSLFMYALSSCCFSFLFCVVLSLRVVYVCLYLRRVSLA
jgi:hypothetical protein